VYDSVGHFANNQLRLSFYQLYSRTALVCHRWIGAVFLLAVSPLSAINALLPNGVFARTLGTVIIGVVVVSELAMVFLKIHGIKSCSLASFSGRLPVLGRCP
jgi:hypothetical protein